MIYTPEKRPLELLEGGKGIVAQYHYENKSTTVLSHGDVCMHVHTHTHTVGFLPFSSKVKWNLRVNQRRGLRGCKSRF